MLNRRRLADDQPQSLAGWRSADGGVYRRPAVVVSFSVLRTALPQGGGGTRSTIAHVLLLFVPIAASAHV